MNKDSWKLIAKASTRKELEKFILNHLYCNLLKGVISYKLNKNNKITNTNNKKYRWRKVKDEFLFEFDYEYVEPQKRFDKSLKWRQLMAEQMGYSNDDWIR